MIQQHGGDIFTGSLGADRADIISDHRHSVYDAGVFVLSDRKGSGLAHLEQSVGAVASHTCHDDADLIDGDILGDRVEQDVYGRTVAADFCAGAALNHVVASGTDHLHLFGAWSDESKSRVDDISVLCLADFHGADPVQALCVHLCKSFRHMLCDHHARNIGREPL